MDKTKAGEHPPRLTARPEEDFWHSGYVKHPERWVGAVMAKRARDLANLETGVRTNNRAAGPFG